MKKKIVLDLVLMVAAALIISPGRTDAFPPAQDGHQCTECHTLSQSEADSILKGMKLNAEVIKIAQSEVPGMWCLVYQDKKLKKKGLMYVSYRKHNVIVGVGMDTNAMRPLDNLTVYSDESDFSKIPLDNAIVIGKKTASHKVAVFFDVMCNYCTQQYEELKKVISQRHDIAFYVMLYPMVNIPEVYEKAKAIQCELSPQLLEDALNGKTVPAVGCETDAIEKNINIGKELGIARTPTMVFADGTMIGVFMTAEQIISKTSLSRSASRSR